MAMSGSPELNDEQLRALYAWIDAIPLSRPKKNIARDFSDGVLLAEVVAAYFPTLVELHNYAPANSLKQKHYNFETLNTRVLKKFGYTIPRETIDDIVCCRPGAVEFVLNSLQYKMAKYREKKAIQGMKANNNNGQTDDNTPEDSVTSRDIGQGQDSNQGSSHYGRPSNPITPKDRRNIGIAVDEEILLEKEKQIRELQETIEILELKIAKLEQLVRLKDNKIDKLMARTNV
jgi:hypothetical protein